ncbi:MAG: RlpA-like double-psi beta-barrel domain-containing protein [Armatimonadetes bacterium]|nr:RlpA-like double-psi beta-barrel domain-containing protein [Armatimonadota bacterium]
MIATFYTSSPGPTASGQRFNPRAYTCAAPYGYRLGDVLLVSRGGRRVRVTVTDRGRLGHGHLDLTPAPFRALAGRHWRKVGVVRGLHCRLVRRGHRRS